MFTGASASSSQKTLKTVELREENHGNYVESPASSMPLSEPPESPQFIDPATITNPHSPQTKLVIHSSLIGPLDKGPPQSMFTISQLGVDRRLLVNRKRQLKMYRVWVQGKFKKQSFRESENSNVVIGPSDIHVSNL